MLHSDQSITDTYQYEAFGNLLSITGSTPNPYRYVGSLGYYATGSSLMHLGARYYMPEIGRFATPDPAGNLNPYGYCGNRPAVSVDPEGSQEQGIGSEVGVELIAAIIAALVAALLGHQERKRPQEQTRPWQAKHRKCAREMRICLTWCKSFDYEHTYFCPPEGEGPPFRNFALCKAACKRARDYCDDSEIGDTSEFPHLN